MGKSQIKELSVSVMIYLDYSTGKHYKSLGYFLFRYQMASALKVQKMKKIKFNDEYGLHSNSPNVLLAKTAI